MVSIMPIDGGSAIDGIVEGLISRSSAIVGYACRMQNVVHGCIQIGNLEGRR